MKTLLAMGLLLMVPASILPLPLPWALYAWLLVAYLIGYALSVLLRADYARFSGVNTFPSRTAFIRRNWVTILIRLVPWDTAVFYVWTLHPEWPAKILLALKVPAWIADWMPSVNIGTALAAGFIIDIGFDKVQSWTALLKDTKLGPIPIGPILNTIFQGRLPQYDEAVVDVGKLSPDRKVGE